MYWKPTVCHEFSHALFPLIFIISPSDYTQGVSDQTVGSKMGINGACVDSGIRSHGRAWVREKRARHQCEHVHYTAGSTSR